MSALVSTSPSPAAVALFLALAAAGTTPAIACASASTISSVLGIVGSDAPSDGTSAFTGIGWRGGELPLEERSIWTEEPICRHSRIASRCSSERREDAEEGATCVRCGFAG
jgi:hypothetical protein